MTASLENLRWMYQHMVLIREYEDTLARIYFEGKLPPNIQKKLAFDIGAGPIPGEMHLSAGQEPAAVGVCVHLREDDSVWATHRSHHFAIAKGVPLHLMTAEIFGKVTGLCRGKGGHMHLYDPAHGFACNGIVGAGIPHACGAALAAQMSRQDSVAVAEFGEGAANQGAFHEALNFAGLWRLPVVFVCQDNDYGISVRKRESTAVASNAQRAAGYSMPGILIEENDPEQMCAAAGIAIARARRGEGPTLIEIRVARLYGHYQGDPESYRPKDETKKLREQDPIPRFENRLKERGVIDDAFVQTAILLARQSVAAAVQFARESPYPNAQEAFEHVFVDGGPDGATQ